MLQRVVQRGLVVIGGNHCTIIIDFAIGVGIGVGRTGVAHALHQHRAVGIQHPAEKDIGTIDAVACIVEQLIQSIDGDVDHSQ